MFKPKAGDSRRNAQRRRRQGPERTRDFTHEVGEFVDVLEVAIDRGETHVGDLVDFLQLTHHHLAHLLGRDFAFAEREQLFLDAGQGGIDRLHRHRALAQRQPDAGGELVAVETREPFFLTTCGRRISARS